MPPYALCFRKGGHFVKKGVVAVKRLLVLLCLLALPLGGCAARRENAPAAPAEENRLVIYTSHKADVYAPIIREFENRTGIWVRVETGGTNEMLDRIAQENGASGADLMFGGGVESLAAYEDYFLPYQAPGLEAVYPGYRGDGTWIPFSSLPVVLIDNPKLVGADRPAGWAELMTDRWRGRIAFADPAVSGSSYTALATLLQVLPGDEAALAASFRGNLEGRVLGGSGLVVGAVARGEFLVGVTLEETARKALAAGMDIRMTYPREGTSAVPDGVALLRGCRHEENAKQFIDFILSPALQRRLAADFSRRSVLAALLPEEAEGDGWTLMKYDISWASENRDAVLSWWREGGKTP